MFYAAPTIRLEEIKSIPGIGSALAEVLSEVGIEEIEDLRYRDPESQVTSPALSTNRFTDHLEPEPEEEPMSLNRLNS